MGLVDAETVLFQKMDVLMIYGKRNRSVAREE